MVMCYETLSQTKKFVGIPPWIHVRYGFDLPGNSPEAGVQTESEFL